MPYSDVDQVAKHLMHLGRIGRAMPPAWDGAQVHQEVCSPEGIHLGRMLPGKGLYLDLDLKCLGIDKPLPYVFEKTKVRKLIDVLKDERWAVAAAAGLTMAALFPKSLLSHLFGPAIFGVVQTYDGIINARGNGNGYDVVFSKASITTVANIWFSTYAVSGNPAAGSFTNIPGGAAPDNTNQGSLLLGVPNPTGGNKAYLLSFGYASGTALNTCLLADLCIQAGNISGSTNASQTINTTALTRYTSGIGLNMILEVTTPLGSSGANVTITYTNQSGTGSRSTGAQAMTTSAIAARLQPGAFVPFTPLQSTDYGIQSVQSLQLSASMTAGVMALEIYKPLSFVPGIAANAWVERDMAIQLSGVTELVQTSGNVLGCIIAYIFASSTTSGLMIGQLRTCQG